MTSTCPNCSARIELLFNDRDEAETFCPKCGEIIEASLDQIAAENRRKAQVVKNNLVSTKKKP